MPAQSGVGAAEVGTDPSLMYLQAVPVAFGPCWDGRSCGQSSVLLHLNPFLVLKPVYFKLS